MHTVLLMASAWCDESSGKALTGLHDERSGGYSIKSADATGAVATEVLVHDKSSSSNRVEAA